MGRLHYISLFLLLSVSAQAQHNYKDSIKLALQAKPKLYAGFHNRNTFVNTTSVKLNGVIAGVNFDNKFKLFAGLYLFGSSNRETILYSDEFAFDTVYKDLSMNYFSLGAVYTFFKQNRLSFSLPVQIGAGRIKTSYQASDSIILQAKTGVFPLESGVLASYDILKWLELKGGVGYRISFGNKEALALSSPFYNLGLAINIGTLYEEIQELMD